MKKDVYNLSKPQESIWLTEQYFKDTANSSNIKKVSIDLSKEHFENVENTAKTINVSSYSVFLAGLYIVLYRYTYQNSINIILKKDINPNEKFSNFLISVHESATNTISNKLSENLNLDGNGASFDVMFSYTTLQENSLTSIDNTQKFDLRFDVSTALNTLSLEFNENLLKLSTAKSLLSHYLFILKQISKNLNCRVSDFEMITPEENQLLKKFNNSISINNNALFSTFDTSVEKPKVYVLDENMKRVPIGNFR